MAAIIYNPVALRTLYQLGQMTWISMLLPADGCLHFGFCSVCEQRRCYTTYFCLFSSVKCLFQIWKTVPLSPPDTLSGHIGQPVVALLPVNGLKIVSGRNGGMLSLLEKRDCRVDNFIKLLCSTLRPCC